jgi:Flp pilus assembly protein TadD
MTTAAVCGAAAFVWALMARVPDDDALIRARALRAANWPHDPARLTEFVAKHPDSLGAWNELAIRLRNNGRAEEARAAWEKAAALALSSGGTGPGDGEPMFILGWASLATNDPTTARIAFGKAAQVYESRHGRNDANTWRNLGWCRFQIGDAPGAGEAWKRAAAMQDQPTLDGLTNTALYNLACYRALAGDREGALAALDAAVAQGWDDRAWAEHDEDFDSIREDPRFGAALGRIARVSIGDP